LLLKLLVVCSYIADFAVALSSYMCVIDMLKYGSKDVSYCSSLVSSVWFRAINIGCDLDLDLLSILTQIDSDIVVQAVMSVSLM